MTNEYTPEPGMWRLISPSGVVHIGDSPMHALQAEQGSRIPADVAMGRVMAALAPSIEDAQDLAEHMALVRRAIRASHSGWSGESMTDAMAAVEASAKQLMGISE